MQHCQQHLNCHMDSAVTAYCHSIYKAWLSTTLLQHRAVVLELLYMLESIS